MLAENIFNFNASIALLENGDDLILDKTCLFHQNLLVVFTRKVYFWHVYLPGRLANLWFLWICLWGGVQLRQLVSPVVTIMLCC